jgi:hypothetical protein
VTDRRLLTKMLVASLVFHAVVALVTWNLDFLAVEPPSARAETAVELVLIPDEPAAADDRVDTDQPTAFTEIPDRLASERPERADFLAMRDSRAADRLPGGQEGDQPGTVREGEFPQVAVQPENLAGAEGVAVENPVLTPPTQPRTSEAQREQAAEKVEQRGAEAGGAGEMLLPAPSEDSGDEAREGADKPSDRAGDYEDWVAEQRAPSLMKEGERQAPGDRGFDFMQLEQGRVGTNVALDGDFTLSTYEWNFAPWMRRFVNDLHRSWIAPYAYKLGIITGYTRIRLVIERDGRPSSMEIVEENGHESLHTASTAALQAFAPYAPLPPDFPDKNLVILLGLHYPAWKR